MKKHIHESNLIEGFDSEQADNLLWNAWLNLRKYLHEDLNKTLICEAHYTLTLHQKEMHYWDKGNYRRKGVTIGCRSCPEPYLASQLMHNWILDMKDHWQTLEPKAMHIRFEKIHPFIDGNGRIGRLLMWWHEEKREREPTLILNSEKEKYYQWFR